eukprot:TRINITY_DN36089_c0_g1_i1.p1 TRINITY_DN36089_c0_g1~~TRINITY_DN36089_c0_g1_i1.p1  ORF type:complete len:371 (-),score=59.40 TRINITY_DN36089_c0_g1_i1:213-1325(-)
MAMRLLVYRLSSLLLPTNRPIKSWAGFHQSAAGALHGSLRKTEESSLTSERKINGDEGGWSRNDESLNWEQASAIVFGADTQKRRLGLDFQLWQAFCACLPPLGVYFVAMYAREDMKRLEKHFEDEKLKESSKKSLKQRSPHSSTNDTATSPHPQSAPSALPSQPLGERSANESSLGDSAKQQLTGSQQGTTIEMPSGSTSLQNENGTKREVGNTVEESQTVSPNSTSHPRKGETDARISNKRQAANGNLASQRSVGKHLKGGEGSIIIQKGNDREVVHSINGNAVSTSPSRVQQEGERENLANGAEVLQPTAVIQNDLKVALGEIQALKERLERLEKVRGDDEKQQRPLESKDAVERARREAPPSLTDL